MSETEMRQKMSGFKGFDAAVLCRVVAGVPSSPAEKGQEGHPGWNYLTFKMNVEG